jgi:hypothetical protein
MTAEVALKVEVRELVVGVDLGLIVVQERLELGISIDEPTVELVLKTVGTDVLGDELGHLGAGHEGAALLAKEVCKVIADLGGLDETTWVLVATVAVLALVHLLEGLELTDDVLLHVLDLGLGMGQLVLQLGEALVVLREKVDDRRGHVRSSRCGGGGRCNRGCRLLHDGWGRRSRGSWLNRGRRCGTLLLRCGRGVRRLRGLACFGGRGGGHSFLFLRR